MSLTLARQPLIKRYEDEMMVCSDTGFHAKTGDPQNLKVCPRGTWNSRMIIETVLAMLTLVNHFKKVMRSRLALLPDALGLDDGRLQHLDAMAWSGA